MDLYLAIHYIGLVFIWATLLFVPLAISGLISVPLFYAFRALQWTRFTAGLSASITLICMVSLGYVQLKKELAGFNMTCEALPSAIAMVPLETPITDIFIDDAELREKIHKSLRIDDAPFKRLPSLNSFEKCWGEQNMRCFRHNKSEKNSVTLFREQVISQPASPKTFSVFVTEAPGFRLLPQYRVDYSIREKKSKRILRSATEYVQTLGLFGGYADWLQYVPKFNIDPISSITACGYVSNVPGEFRRSNANPAYRDADLRLLGFEEK
jgi:hypothetical protein